MQNVEIPVSNVYTLNQKFPDISTSATGGLIEEYYANADVFVFPSKTDTLGNVILEALACGTPIAAFPVTGPNDTNT